VIPGRIPAVVNFEMRMSHGASALLAIFLMCKDACEASLHVPDTRGSIRMLALADWGGNDITPYTTPSQRWTAAAMGIIGTVTRCPLFCTPCRHLTCLCR
jgi:hypothetical protein